MRKIDQNWVLSGYCSECRRSLEIQNLTNIAQIMKLKKYYQLMLNDNRPVAKCENCGAYYEGFSLIPVY